MIGGTTRLCRLAIASPPTSRCTSPRALTTAVSAQTVIRSTKLGISQQIRRFASTHTSSGAPIMAAHVAPSARPRRMGAPLCASAEPLETVAPEPLEMVEVSGGPFERGRAIGVRFGDRIRDRVAKAPFLQSVMVPFSKTDEGRRVVAGFAEANRSLYPDYWDELRGMADGSSVTFEELLLLNLRKEIGAFLPETKGAAAAAAAAAASAEGPTTAPSAAAASASAASEHQSSSCHCASSDDCSDVLLLTSARALVGHNEDADYSLVGNTFLVRMLLPSGLSFTAYAYAGELTTVAFGFNSARMAFSMDACPPAPSEVSANGVARNFVARSLMEARSMGEAVELVTLPSVSVGHHYVIMDCNSRRIASVETASRGRSSVLELGCGCEGWGGGGYHPFGSPTEAVDGCFKGCDKGCLIGYKGGNPAAAVSAAAAAASGGNGGSIAASTAAAEAAEAAKASEASSSSSSVSSACVSSLFHANAYMRLKLTQAMGPSSHRRHARAAALGAPTCKEDILKILSDSEDVDFPIFNLGKVYEAGGPAIHTLHAAFFDLDEGTVLIYGGRSTEERVLHTFTL